MYNLLYIINLDWFTWALLPCTEANFSAFFSDVWWMMTTKWETEPHSTWMFWSKNRKPSMLATSWTVKQKVLKTRLHLSWFNTWQRDSVTCGLRGFFLLSPGLTVSIPGLERALHQYTLEPSEKPFDLRSVPLATAPIIEQRAGENQSAARWSELLTVP